MAGVKVLHAVIVFCFSAVIESNLASSCALDDWIGDQPERGTHVVCLQGGSAQVYPHCDKNLEFSISEVSGSKALLKTVFKQVKRTSAINFPEKKLSYRNQLPAVYTAAGDRNPGKLADGVYLIFEGGLWRWPPVRLGFRRELESSTLITMSVRPAVFQVVVNEQWFQTLSKFVLPAAQPLFRKSVTGDINEANHNDDNVRSSETAWLPYSSAELRKQEALTQNLVRVPLSRFEHNMQVVRYTPGTFYDSHRDYWDPREFPNSKWTDSEGRWHNRFATVLWYLSSPSEGGETWFPRARGGDIPWGQWRACDDRGTKVQATNGTAVLFYSLLATGELDEYSWHCGCPVKGKDVKIAANSWIWSGLSRRPDRSEL